MALACGLALASCAAPRPERVELKGIDRALVFPFENLSTDQPNDAGKRMTVIFAAALSRMTGIEVVEPGEVERFVEEERIRGVDNLNRDVLRTMASRFRLQMVVVGVVDEFGYVQLGEQVPVVGLTIRVIDARSGRLVWSTTLSREGTDGEIVFQIGKIRSVSRLAEEVVDDICGHLAASREEIAASFAQGERVAAIPVDRPTRLEPTASEPSPGSDDEREEVRRAVKRHWEIIKEQREK